MSLKHFLTIRHSMLKDRLIELVQLCFRKKIQRRYNYIVFGKDKSYFVKKAKNTLILPKGSLKLIDNIFVMFVGRACQQRVGISMYPSSLRVVSVFIHGRLHTRDSQEKWKEAFLIL